MALVLAEHDVYGICRVPESYLTRHADEWTAVPPGTPVTPTDPYPVYLRDTELADAITAGTGPVPAALRAAFVSVSASEEEADALPGQPLVLVLASVVAAPTVAPTGLTLTPSTTSVQLTYAAVSGATGYEYRIGTTNPPASTPVAAAGTSATASGLAPSTTYRVQVRALNAGGPGPWSAAESTTTLADVDIAPAVPTGLTATGGVGTLTLDWTDNTEEDLSGVTPYEYRYGVNNPPQGSPVTAAESQAVVSSLAAGSYYAQVRARDAAGNTSAWSSVGGPATVTAPSTSAPLPVQKKSGSAGTTSVPVTTHTIALDSPPVAGADVVVSVSLDRAATQMATPSGWTLDATFVGDGTYGGISFFRRRVVAGQEAACQTFTVTTTLGCLFNSEIYEVANLAAASPVDKTFSASYASGTTALVGPTAATAQASEIAFVHRRTQGAAGTPVDLTDGFTTDPKNTDTTTRAATGHKVLSATGTVQTTSAWTNARTAAALLVTYKGV